MIIDFEEISVCYRVREAIVPQEQKPDGTIVLLPGWGRSVSEQFGSDEWKFMFGTFMPRYRIIGIDSPGLGLSSAPDGKPWGTYEYASFLGRFMDRLEVESCILVGHSFGGRVATATALLYPSRVEKLILIAPAGIVRRSLKVRAKILWYKAVKKPLKKLFPNWQRLKDSGSRDYRNAGSDFQRGVIARVSGENLEPELKKLRTPTMVIWGSQDTELPPKYLEIYREMVPEIMGLMIPGADHFPHVDRPEAVKNAIEHFLVNLPSVAP